MKEPTYTKLSITAFEHSACLCNVCGAIVLERTRVLHSAHHQAQDDAWSAGKAVLCATTPETFHAALLALDEALGAEPQAIESPRVAG